MRLARGAGVKGLAGMRRVSRGPGGAFALVRPLLRWRHSELEAVCAAAGVEPALDPSNADEQFERVRDPQGPCRHRFARSRGGRSKRGAPRPGRPRAPLGDRRSNGSAPSAEIGAQLVYKPTDAPREIRRRIIRRAILRLATEGGGAEPRGRELDQILAALPHRQARHAARGALHRRPPNGASPAPRRAAARRPRRLSRGGRGRRARSSAQARSASFSS